VLANRDFRLLWFGQAVSVLGDQFQLIALPWLVLQLTGDPVAVGAVLALAGIPRAVFMLLGGALVDRTSPRTIMLVSNVARMVIVSFLALIVFSTSVEMWMIYALALAFGLADAFFFPAVGAIVPRLVPTEQLAPANALINGTTQLAVMLGPALAGLLITVFGGGASVNGETVPDLQGIGLAFAVNALTFLVSAVTLWAIRLAPRPAPAVAEPPQSVWSAIRAGLAFVWNDVVLRQLFLLIAMVNIFVNGTIQVGIPVLADTRYAGAASFGIILSAYGGGALLGTLLAGILPRPRPERFGAVLLSASAALGLLLAVFGLLQTFWIAVLVMALIGVSDGYVVVSFQVWLQARTPLAVIGRVMSVLMLAVVGVNPLAALLAGLLIEVDLTLTFVFSGLLTTGVTLAMLRGPAIRRMGEDVLPP
jgi:MFS family permease